MIRLFFPGLILLFLAGADCEEIYPEQPEVIVTNRIAQHVMIRSISYNGCKWDGVLAYEESTAPQRCLLGEDRVHFKRFDAISYCIDQVEDGTIEGLCFCDESDYEDDEPSATDPGLINTTPLWFNYMTVTRYNLQDSDLIRIELTADDMAQDFSIPGPYGH